jgi:AraC family transcriptional regulator
MERAAFLLQTTDQTILEIAVDSGYRTGEALSRAFREAFGMLPSEFRRRKDQTWQLPGPTDLHWNAHWGIDEPASIPGGLGASVVHRPAQLAAVWRAVGNYKYLSESWKRFEEALGAHVPRDGTAKFITIYYDSIWTHPVSNTMRADIGWIVGPSDPVPPKMRRIVIPGGLYAVSDRYVARTERNDGWSYMSAIWLPRRNVRHELLSFDEYKAWPLPFEQVETRMVVGLAAVRTPTP